MRRYMPRIVSIRRSLIVNLILVITVLSGTIMLTMILGARSAIRTLSRVIINQTIEQTEGELKRFFDPPAAELMKMKSLGEKGMIDINDSAALKLQFMAIMRQYPQITSLMVADETGREFMLLKTGNKWVNRLSKLDGTINHARIFEWTHPDGPVVETRKEIDYDPRQRPWYVGATRKWEEYSKSVTMAEMPDLIHWTEPYKFFTAKEVGITVSVRLNTTEGRAFVIGFDILLKDIQKFTDQMKILKHGQLVILTTEDVRRIIGFSVREHYGDEVSADSVMLKSPEELGIPLFDDARTAFRRRDMVSGSNEPVRFISVNRAWWGAGRRYSLTSDRGFLMAVLIPESDLLGSLEQHRIWILAITLGVLVLGIARTVVLANRYSRPIEALVTASDRISKGDLEPGKPVESRVSEVIQLTEAHERMRLGLKTLMKLERDLQLARQIQQKTLPQHLPQISGFQIHAWNEPAEETGGDTYDVVGYALIHGEDSVKIETDTAERAILLLADAAGHGIGPALSVTQLRAMLRMAVHIEPDISVIARHLNQQLYADLPEGRFITAWLGEINAANSTLRYFSAGQGPLLHFTALLNEVAILPANTVPFGISDAIQTSPAESIEMNEGDIFAVISDGIFESMNHQDEQYDTDRVIEERTGADIDWIFDLIPRKGGLGHHLAQKH